MRNHQNADLTQFFFSFSISDPQESKFRIAYTLSATSPQTHLSPVPVPCSVPTGHKVEISECRLWVPKLVNFMTVMPETHVNDVG